MLGLSQIQMIIIGAALAVVLTAGGIAYIYNKGGAAKEAEIRSTIATETVKTLDAARISKEKTDAEVHSTPYGERVDGVR